MPQKEKPLGLATGYRHSINHHLLAARLHTLIPDEEIVRLIMLCVQMGVVNKYLKWNDSLEGVPQGAILSPLLSNFYLNPFDKYVLTLCRSYVRYADDFCLMCETHDQAKSILKQVSVYLKSTLGLELNPPIVVELRKGFEFLGITISKSGLSLSAKKEQDLKERVSNLKLESKGFVPKSLRSWNGVRVYYGTLLPQHLLRTFDDLLYERMKEIVAESFKRIANRNVLKRHLSEVDFLSNEYQLYKNRLLQDYINLYDQLKASAKGEKITTGNNRVPGCRNWVWWDADLLRETFKGDDNRWGAGSFSNGRKQLIWKWQGDVLTTGIEGDILMIADMEGDWREEIITALPGEIRIYHTNIPATDRRVTLMQDYLYRSYVAHRSMGYPQAPVPSYYLGK